jgi:hypothetical protein
VKCKVGLFSLASFKADDVFITSNAFLELLLLVVSFATQSHDAECLRILSDEKSPLQMGHFTNSILELGDAFEDPAFAVSVKPKPNRPHFCLFTPLPGSIRVARTQEDTGKEVVSFEVCR